MALLIAKEQKNYNIRDNLVLLAVIKKEWILYGDKISGTLLSIDVSNDTIKKRKDCIRNYKISITY